MEDRQDHVTQTSLSIHKFSSGTCPPPVLIVLIKRAKLEIPSLFFFSPSHFVFRVIKNYTSTLIKLPHTSLKHIIRSIHSYLTKKSRSLLTPVIKQTSSVKAGGEGRAYSLITFTLRFYNSLFLKRLPEHTTLTHTLTDRVT